MDGARREVGLELAVGGLYLVDSLPTGILSPLLVAVAVFALTSTQ